MIRSTAFVLMLVLFFVGCTPSQQPGNGNANTSDNGNANDNLNINMNDNGVSDGVVEAEVEFPEASSNDNEDLKIVAIEEAGGTEGTFFGTVGELGEEAIIDRLESETSSETFIARFDDVVQPREVEVGETDLVVSYNEDGTIDYVIRDAGEVVANGFSIPRDVVAQGVRRLRAVTPQDIIDCGNDLLAELAGGGEEFASCLQGRSDLSQLAQVVCTAEQILSPALTDVDCAEQPDPQTCQDRSAPALQASDNMASVVRTVLGDAISQIAQSALDDCTTFDPSIYLGPIAYASEDDSPFALISSELEFFLEDFETGELSTPGVTASAGEPKLKGEDTHSVDFDDGVLDGDGTDGTSFFSSNGAAGITFSFDEEALGFLPTRAGIVWTDGEGLVSFEAFDENGDSLGVFGPFDFPGSGDRPTDDDRFLGIAFAAGVTAISISNTAGAIEVDHLQYGN